MDYIRLKKTLMAVFDHFLSCHDIHDLERMMQTFEAGQGLNIRLPEKIHRNDYKDDLQFMAVSVPKTIKSRVSRTKNSVLTDGIAASLRSSQRRVPLRHREPEGRGDLPEKDGASSGKTASSSYLEHICDVPIMMSLAEMDPKQSLMLGDVLTKYKNKIMFKDVIMQEFHGFATAVVSRVVRRDSTGSTPSKNISSSTRTDLSTSLRFGRDDILGGRHGVPSDEIASSPCSSQRRDPLRHHEPEGRGDLPEKNGVPSSEIASSFYSSQRRVVDNSSFLSPHSSGGRVLQDKIPFPLSNENVGNDDLGDGVPTDEILRSMVRQGSPTSQDDSSFVGGSGFKKDCHTERKRSISQEEMPKLSQDCNLERGREVCSFAENGVPSDEILRPQGAQNDSSFSSPCSSGGRVVDHHSLTSIKAGTSFADALHHAMGQEHTEQSFRERLMAEISRRIKKCKDPPS